MVRFSLFLITVSMSCYAYAHNTGFVKGNGGNVLYCPTVNQTITLDSYEQSARFDLRQDVSLLNSENFYEVVLRKADKISFNFSQSLKKSIEKVLANMLILENIDLGAINDSYPFFIPIHCEMKLAALQRNGKILISSFYWNQLKQDQKLFLIMHEALYFQILEKHSVIDDSEPIRILNALLLSEEMVMWKQKELFQFLKQHHLLKYL